MKRQWTKARSGFTLTELIIVLVVLAILAAVLIPVLSGYVDKTRQKAAVAECRACVVAAQTLASEAYAAVPLTTDTIQSAGNLGEIEALAEVEGDIRAIILSGESQVTKLVYRSDSGFTVTYEDGKYTVTEGTGSVTLLTYSSLTGKAKQDVITQNIWLLDTVFQDYFTSLMEEYYPTAAYTNREFITLTYPAVNQSETVAAIWDAAGRKLNVGTGAVQLYVAKWFYEESGLVDAESAKAESVRAYFETISVGGSTRYKTTVWYYSFKGVNAATGADQTWYYIPATGEYTTVKPAG